MSRRVAPHSLIALIGLIWSAELLLARLTFGQQTWLDIGVSGLVLLVTALGLERVGTLATSEPTRQLVYRSLAPSLPLAAIVAHMLSVALRARMDEGVAAFVGLLVLIALPVLGAVLAVRTREALPTVPVVFGVLVVAFVVSAVSRAGLAAVSVSGDTINVGIGTDLPPPLVWLGVLLAWAVAAWLATVRGGGWGILVGTVLVVRVPGSAPDPTWTQTSPAPADRPDIVLITVDTLRADAGAEMATVSLLAERGTSFTGAQAPAPWTLPSMGTLMTGEPIEVHGAAKVPKLGFTPMRGEVQTLAEKLSAEGYDTAAFVSPNAFVGSGFGFGRGFDHFEHSMERASYALPMSANDSLARVMVLDVLVSMGLTGRRSFGGAEVLVDRAEALLDQRRDRPLFLWLHFLDCHEPFRNVHDTTLPFLVKNELSGGLLSDVVQTRGLGSPELWEVYRNEVAHIDRALLPFVEGLLGSERETLIAFTSDHGEEFFEHGNLGHGLGLYQEVLHIPMLVAGLDGASAQVDEVVGLDFLHFLLAGAGATGERGLPPLWGDPVLSFNLLYGPQEHFARRDGRWKWVMHGQTRGLFDLSTDPGELKDLSGANPSIVRALDVPPPAIEVDEGAEMSNTELRMLEVLGYVE